MERGESELHSLFKSAHTEAEYVAAYEASLRRWPVPHEESDLESRFGRTHVLASGPADRPPLVLLHGFGASSTMWAASIAALTSRYRVYAVDVIGQAGKSLPRVPLATRADCAAWLTSVLDGIGIDRAHLVGMSYGGWLTLNFAIAAPDRLRAIALLSPGGLLPLTPMLRLRAMLASIVPTQRCSDLVLMRWVSSKQRVEDDEHRALTTVMARQMYLGLRVRSEYVRRGAPANPFSDDELRSLRVPTLLLIGEDEVLYDSAEALTRARRLIPELVGALIPRANHLLTCDRSDVVDARLLAFLATIDERPRPAPLGGEPAADYA